MSTGERIPLQTALWLSAEVTALLMDCCESICMAGSLRRLKEDVGDVELVAQPRYASDFNYLEARCEQLLERGLFSKRLTSAGNVMSWGDGSKPVRRKAAIYHSPFQKLSVVLDLWIVLPDREIGPTMILRTGPDRANRALVTQVGSRTPDYHDHGVLPIGLRFEGGALWHLNQRLPTPTEHDVFHALKLPWLPPPERTAANYLYWAKHRDEYTGRFGVWSTDWNDESWRMRKWAERVVERTGITPPLPVPPPAQVTMFE